MRGKERNSATILCLVMILYRTHEAFSPSLNNSCYSPATYSNVLTAVSVLRAEQSTAEGSMFHDRQESTVYTLPVHQSLSMHLEQPYHFDSSVDYWLSVLGGQRTLRPLLCEIAPLPHTADSVLPLLQPVM